MDCEMFKKDIGEFASRPLLHDKMILLHQKQNPNCKCDIKLLVMTYNCPKCEKEMEPKEDILGFKKFHCKGCNIEATIMPMEKMEV